MRKALLWASTNAWLRERAMRTRFVRVSVRKFMPGEQIEDAIAAAVELKPKGVNAIFTKLGEAITNKAEATAVRDHYLWLFDQIKARALPATVSVKPTQLGLDIDPGLCQAYTEELAKKAADCGSFLWIDMEDSTYVDRTLALYRAVKIKFPATGLAMQAYLFRTPKDLQEFQRFMTDWVAAVQAAASAGKTIDEATASIDLSAKYPTYKKERYKASITAVYAELGK